MLRLINWIKTKNTFKIYETRISGTKVKYFSQTHDLLRRCGAERRKLIIFDSSITSYRLAQIDTQGGEIK